MDLSTFKRNKDVVRANLVKLDDKSVVTKRGCKIYIPLRYVSKGLAGIGEIIWSVGVFVMTTDDAYYATMLAPIRMTLTPSDVREIKLGGVAYYELSFEPGSVVIENSVLKVDTVTVINPLFNEFIINGNAPYGFNLLDMIKLFSLSEKYANFEVGANHQIYESIINIIARDNRDYNKQYRYQITNIGDIDNNPPALIGLRNAAITSTNTQAKLVGSYFNDGVIAALTNQADRVEGIEEILRK